MNTTVIGSSDYLRGKKLSQLIEEYKDSNGDYSLSKVDAEDTSTDDVIRSVSSVPFLANKRMVVLSGIDKNDELVNNIDKILSSVAPTTDLIIEGRIDKRTSFYKTLKNGTNIVEYSDPTDRSLADWIVQETSGRGGSITLGDALFIVDRVGLNQMKISNELDKLLLYSKTISKNSITLLVNPSPASTIFDLLASCFSKNHREAIRLYEDQRMQQIEPQFIFSMISWQLHILLVAFFIPKDISQDTITKSGIKPYTLQKTKQLAKMFNINDLLRVLDEAVYVDSLMKTRSVKPDDVMKYFLLAI